MTEPLSPTSEDPDTFHGRLIPDPFRWLDDETSPKVTEWTAHQNAMTSRFLDGVGPRESVRVRISQLWDHRRSGLPSRAGGRTFVLRMAGLQEHPVLYSIDNGDAETATALVDPNVMAADGSVAMTGWTVDPGGRLLAYALSHGGRDRQEIRIRDVDTLVDYPEVIRWVKSEEDLPFPNVAWAPDASGFYYNRLPTPGTVDPSNTYRHSQVYWHRLGTSQDQDVLIFERPDDPDLNFVPIVTDDGAFLLLHVWKGLSGRHQVYVRPLESVGDFVPLIPEANAKYVFLGNKASRFYFHTNAGAPRGRVIAVDMARPHPADWHEVISERRNPIYRASLFDERVVLVTIRDAQHAIELFATDGRPGPAIELPDPGTVSDVGYDPSTEHLLVAFESFLRPKGILHYDIETGVLVEDASPPIPFDASSYVTKHRFVPAADGTLIPATIVHRTDLVRDGSNPLLLYGYGGFNVSTTPLFDPSLLAWLEHGGVYAIANPRGGGEYGEEWHDAGRRHAKQICFDDFQTVSEWLITSGYTTPSRLAIRGESNGGLLVAACMLQRPDLFGAVVCSLPVADMLRFANYTIGHYWTHEYGDARSSQEDFATLYRYSPLENVKGDVDYPPILITTGDGDDRVVPSHAMKLAATLQGASRTGSAATLLRVQHGVGHGLGKPTSKIIELDADIFTFLLGTIGGM